jgi:hypothetical protein
MLHHDAGQVQPHLCHFQFLVQLKAALLFFYGMLWPDAAACWQEAALGLQFYTDGGLRKDITYIFSSVAVRHKAQMLAQSRSHDARLNTSSNQARRQASVC